MKQHLVLSDITIDADPLSVLTVDSGKILSYSKGTIASSQGTFQLTGIPYNASTILLNGNHSIFLLSGSFPLNTLVLGTGNRVDSNGDILGAITLQDDQAELTCNINGSLFKNISMNGDNSVLLPNRTIP